MKKLFVFLFLCSLVVLSLHAEATDEQIEPTRPLLLPQGPNVFEFPIYGNTPVDFYTGTINFSIPIYEINVDGISIPLTLNYVGNGIKVSQDASNVGLGWYMQCGGSVSLDCYGKNDFDRNGGYFNSIFPNGVPDETEQPEYGMNNGDHDITRWDTRPDLYTYSFAGHQGTMVFSRTNQTTPTLLTADSYMEFQYTHDARRWVAYDGEGNKYTFGTKYQESANRMTSNTRTLSDGGGTVSTIDNPNMLASNWEYRSINAWPIDSIITKHGRKIRFSYHLESMQTPVVSQEEVRLVPGVEANEKISGSCIYSTSTYTNSHISSDICSAVLDDVIFPNGRIQFYSSSRLDIWEGSMGGRDKQMPSKLDSIVIYLGTKTHKSISFHYHYIGDTSSPNTCRLLLDSVSGIAPKPYKFSYYPVQLPPKNSRQIDIWGYYNGSSSTPAWGTAQNATSEGTLIPSLRIEKAYYVGRNRNINNALLANAMLRSVVYPTGGKTIFQYEPHQFSPIAIDAICVNPIFQIKEMSLNYSITRRNEDHSHLSVSSSDAETYKMFEVDSTTVLDVELCSSLNMAIYNNDMPSIVSYFVIKDELYNEVYRQEIRLVRDLSENCTIVHLPKFSSGTYRMTIEDANNEDISGLSVDDRYILGMLNVHAKLSICKQPIFNGEIEQGCGVRVSSVQDYDKNNQLVSQREYHYTHPDKRSSGVLMVPPCFNKIYESEFYNIESPRKGPHPLCYPALCYLISSSMLLPQNPMLRSVPIGYSYVIEEYSSPEQNGRVEYEFYSQKAIQFSRLPGYYSLGNLHNGELLERKVYSKDNELIESQQYSRTFRSDYSIKGMHYIQLFPPRYYDTGNQQVNNIMMDKYEIQNLRKTKEETRNMLYFSEGESLVSTTVVTYDSATYLPQRTMSVIRQDTFATEYTYAGMNLFPESEMLCSRHYHKVPLCQTESENGKITSVTKYQYEMQGNRYYVNSEYKLKSLESSDTIWTYCVKSFDNYGNPTTITTPTEIPVAYFWGCSSSYPIIQVIGINSAQLESAISFGMLTMLRSSCDLTKPMLESIYNNLVTAYPDTEITIRSYIPHVGVSLEMTPQGVVYSYEYDAYNRLSAIYRYSNDDKELIEQYEYHYYE